MSHGALDAAALVVRQGAGVVEVVGAFGFNDEVEDVATAGVIQGRAAEHESEIRGVVSERCRDLVEIGKLDEAENLRIGIGRQRETALEGAVGVAEDAVIDATVWRWLNGHVLRDDIFELIQRVELPGRLVGKAAKLLLKLDATKDVDGDLRVGVWVAGHFPEIGKLAQNIEDKRVGKPGVLAPLFHKVER